jgi:hypothetical protein
MTDLAGACVHCSFPAGEVLRPGCCLLHDRAYHGQKLSVLYRFDWTETGVLTMVI